MVPLGLVREMSSYSVEIVAWRCLSLRWRCLVSLALSNVSLFLVSLALDRRVLLSDLVRGDLRLVWSAWSPAFELRFRRRESPRSLTLALELSELAAGAMVLLLMGETMVTWGQLQPPPSSSSSSSSSYLHRRRPIRNQALDHSLSPGVAVPGHHPHSCEVAAAVAVQSSANIVWFGFHPRPLALAHSPTSIAPVLPSHSPEFTQPSGESQHDEYEYGSGNHDENMACWVRSRSTTLSSPLFHPPPSDSLLSSFPTCLLLLVGCRPPTMWPTYLVVISTILALGRAQKITTTDAVSLPSPTMRRARVDVGGGRAKSERRKAFAVVIATGPSALSLPLSAAGEVSKRRARYVRGRTTDTSVGRTDDLRDRDHGRQQ